MARERTSTENFAICSNDLILNLKLFYMSNVCELVSKEKINANQMSCCSAEDCRNDLTNCWDPTQHLVLCHDVNKVDACLRFDEQAKTVCQQKDSEYCVWTGIDKEMSQNYSRALELHKWAMARISLADSVSGRIACYNEKSKKYEGCGQDGNSDGRIWEVECLEDFFLPNVTCRWSFNETTNLLFNYQGGTCQKNGSKGDATTESKLNWGEIIGIIIGIASLIVAVVGVWFAYKQLKTSNHKPKSSNQQLNETEAIELTAK